MTKKRHEMRYDHAGFFASLPAKRPLLMAQYRVQCTYLITLLQQPSPSLPELIKEVTTTLALAERLEHVYTLLNEPTDINQLRNHQRILHAFLNQQHRGLRDDYTPQLIPTTNISTQIRIGVASTNWYRLTAVRLRRLLAAVLLFKLPDQIRPWMNGMQQTSAPFFLHLGWLYFIPRLSANGFIIAKHVIPNRGLSDAERNIPWYLRLSAQLNLHRRGFELTNDLYWFIGGVLCCFVFVGTAIPWRIPITIALQCLDLVVSSVRAYNELRLLYQLKAQYHDKVLHHHQTPNPGYLRTLEQRIAYESRFHGLAIANNILLIVSILTILPACVAFNPLIPLTGALLALIASVYMALGTARIQAQRPVDDLSKIANHRLFQPRSTLNLDNELTRCPPMLLTFSPTGQAS